MGNMAGYREAFIAAQVVASQLGQMNKDHQVRSAGANLRHENRSRGARGNIYVAQPLLSRRRDESDA